MTQVRVVAVLAVIGALGAISAGLANAAAPNPARDIRLLAAFGIYFLAMAIGTLFLRKVAAVLLVLPLAAAGVFVVIQTAIQGPERWNWSPFPAGGDVKKK